MTDFEIVFRDLLDALGQLELRYIVGGSLSSSAFGQPRQTNDIDIVLEIPDRDVANAANVFSSKFMVSEAEMREAVSSHEPFPCFQLLHLDKFLKVDVFVKLDAPAHNDAFERRRKIKFVGDLEAWFYSPEDTVLQKIRWYERPRPSH
jgi:hypothetical protein